jgi:FkbM family methyltransferase
MSATPSTDADGRSHAQFEEDCLLQEIFGERADGYCAEVGAYDGRTGSATWLFEQRGWHCLLVEPIPQLAEEIRKRRSGTVVNCAASDREGTARFFVAEHVEQMSTLERAPDHLAWIEQVGGAVRETTVRTARLDSLLAEASFPELQFVTIDVEGHELAVLEGFTLETYRPRIVIVEDNSESGDPRASRGDPRVASHMAEHGYVPFRRTGVNEWYAHESDTELVRADAVRRYRQAKAFRRWQRQGKFLSNRIATRVGARLPVPVKRRLRQPFDRLRAGASKR